jgi:hypothetical protein
MKTHTRCRHCGSRRKLAKHPLEYRLQPKCLCGARDWRKDEYRHRVELEQIRLHLGRYALCHSCFHYPHRIGSEGCIFHADGSYRDFLAS